MLRFLPFLLMSLISWKISFCQSENAQSSRLLFNYLSEKSFSSSRGKIINPYMTFDTWGRSFYNHSTESTFIPKNAFFNNGIWSVDYNNSKRIAPGEKKLNIDILNNLITSYNYMTYTNDTFYLIKSESNQIKNESNQFDGWQKKGIYKIEMKNPANNNYDEIMMLNPGKFIEIRNDKDVRIKDVDIFSLVFGKEMQLFYNYALFIDGKIQSTTIPQTVFYRGTIELKNNEGSNLKTGAAGIYFMQGNGKKLIEIANDICKCYCRLYYSDQVGLTMY